jgi:hypothetical protein
VGFGTATPTVKIDLVGDLNQTGSNTRIRSKKTGGTDIAQLGNGVLTGDPDGYGITTMGAYPLIFGKGIAAFNGFGQSDFCWYLRLQNTIIDIFASLHKTQDLMVSFDGFSCFFSQNQQSKLWWHIDQLS